MSYFFHQVASLCSEHCYLIDFLLFGHMGLGFLCFSLNVVLGLSDCMSLLLHLYHVLDNFFLMFIDYFTKYVNCAYVFLGVDLVHIFVIK